MYRVAFLTQGCSANIADSEIMAGILKDAGFEILDDCLLADVVIFNTCTVKGPTESFFKKKMKELLSLDKKIIIAGCIPQSETLSEFEDCSMIGTYQVHNIVPVVEETLNGNVVRLLARENSSRLNLPKIRRNDLIEIVPVNHGCVGSCNFCKTKHARGALFSYPISDVVRHISSAVKEGAEEFWITSQDLGAYGKDIETNLSELIKAILTIPGQYRLRIGMANPDLILSYLDELIWLFKENKVYKFIHVPVQSGSNRVLEKMNRPYSVEDFKFIVRRFRDEIPNINIATDIICGHPGETKKDFEETLALVREIKPDVINISKYWAREGTVSAKMKQVNGEEKKRRSSELTKLFQEISLEKNKSWIGKTCNVFVAEKGKDNTYIGRNESYKPVILKSQESLIGDWLEVKITGADVFYLKGKIV